MLLRRFFARPHCCIKNPPKVAIYQEYQSGFTCVILCNFLIVCGWQQRTLYSTLYTVAYYFYLSSLKSISHTHKQSSSEHDDAHLQHNYRSCRGFKKHIIDQTTNTSQSNVPFIFAAALDEAYSQDTRSQEADSPHHGNVDPAALPVTSAERQVSCDKRQLAVGQERHFGGHHTKLGQTVSILIVRHPSIPPRGQVSVSGVMSPSPPPLPPPSPEPSLLWGLDVTPFKRRRRRRHRRGPAEGVVGLDHSAVILVSFELSCL